MFWWSGISFASELIDAADATLQFVLRDHLVAVVLARVLGLHSDVTEVLLTLTYARLVW
jgi:hypothetical protein